MRTRAKMPALFILLFTSCMNLRCRDECPACGAFDNYAQNEHHHA